MEYSMQRTVAVIVVTTPKVFNWLGHMPLMTWSLVQLKEVRGIDNIVCVAYKELTKRSKEMLDKDIEVHTLPDSFLKLSDLDLDKYLVSINGPVNDADVVLVLYPTLPFLSSSKIEGCLDLVRRNLADISHTVQECNIITNQGNKSHTYADVPGCRAFIPSKINNITKAKHITVSLIESINVLDPDNYKIAKALVNEGDV